MNPEIAEYTNYPHYRPHYRALVKMLSQPEKLTGGVFDQCFGTALSFRERVLEALHYRSAPTEYVNTLGEEILGQLAADLSEARRHVMGNDIRLIFNDKPRAEALAITMRRHLGLNRSWLHFSQLLRFENTALLRRLFRFFDIAGMSAVQLENVRNHLHGRAPRGRPSTFAVEEALAQPIDQRRRWPLPPEEYLD